MIVTLEYDRTYPPHSEWQVQQTLSLLSPSLPGEYTIATSTAAIFFLVRAYCYKHSIELVAYYHGTQLKIDRNMRMAGSDWGKVPDFEIYDECLEVLLSEKA